MEKDHQLDAPDNDSLRTIEQLSDRSELSTLYPHGHDDWEGKQLLSRDDREEKRNKEQEKISLSIRRWFAVIGALVTVPFVLFSIGVAAAATYLDPDDMKVVFVPVAGAVALFGYISYRAIKAVYTIFYNHAIKATPFVAFLIGLVGLSVYGLLLITQFLHTGNILHDVTVICASAVLTSIMYSGILLLLWATPHISGKTKLRSIALLFIVISILTTLAWLSTQ